MFLFLSKLLPQLVYPGGLLFLFLISILIWRRNEKLVLIFGVLALLLLFVAGNRWVSMSLARTLEWRYFPPDPLPEADLIVVLGGATEAWEEPRTAVEYNSAVDRIFQGASLYREGAAEQILLSGGGYNIWLDTQTDSVARQMADTLLLLGVPREAMLLEERSNNTYENALYTRQMMEGAELPRIYLVTSASHMPRSAALFEQQGFEVIPVPTDYSVTQASWDNLFKVNWQTTLLNILPNTSSLKTTSTVMKEYIGMLIYRLRGWL